MIFFIFDSFIKIDKGKLIDKNKWRKVFLSINLNKGKIIKRKSNNGKI